MYLISTTPSPSQCISKKKNAERMLQVKLRGEFWLPRSALIIDCLHGSYTSIIFFLFIFTPNLQGGYTIPMLHKRELRFLVFKYIRTNYLQNLDLFIPSLKLIALSQVMALKEVDFQDLLGHPTALSSFRFEGNISGFELCFYLLWNVQSWARFCY